MNRRLPTHFRILLSLYCRLPHFNKLNKKLAMFSLKLDSIAEAFVFSPFNSITSQYYTSLIHFQLPEIQKIVALKMCLWLAMVNGHRTTRHTLIVYVRLLQLLTSEPLNFQLIFCFYDEFCIWSNVERILLSRHLALIWNSLLLEETATQVMYVVP